MKSTIIQALIFSLGINLLLVIGFYIFIKFEQMKEIREIEKNGGQVLSSNIGLQWVGEVTIFNLMVPGLLSLVFFSGIYALGKWLVTRML
ncbi:hypothetical protein ACFO9Q_10980 [Paenibacillus sp. GCM10023252]|uniref:hypothetical protein n=1 Tax=Paenibacillus sp. GCM10023252 TaxID=3252649 RepID=UPI00361BDED7